MTARARGGQMDPIAKLEERLLKREIDVLLTTEVSGYPVRLALECKNESKPAVPVQQDACRALRLCGVRR